MVTGTPYTLPKLSSTKLSLESGLPGLAFKCQSGIFKDVEHVEKLKKLQNLYGIYHLKKSHI